MVLTLALLAQGFAPAAMAAEQPGGAITFGSLLQEMVSRDEVARFPRHDFRLKQDSSYNRVSTKPEPPRNEPKGWFANHDFNSSDRDKNFIRIEENGGRKEWVLMEDTGPGAIVRTWMPWKGQSKPTSSTIIRFYLDGQDEPAIEGNEFELFQGAGIAPFPLAHQSLRSAVSFLPIPYAKGCKVTVSERPFFYQFTYRKYQEGAPVTTFRMEDLAANATLIRDTCATLLAPTTSAASPAEPKLAGKLESGQEMSLKLTEGTAAVRGLSVWLGGYDDPNVTRSVVLKMEFDGKQTVWCPLSEFFGTGVGLNPFQGWYRTVANDGTMSSRWVMPYRESGAISIVNLGAEPVEFELKASIGDWQWDDRSLYFHAAWRGQYPVPTRPFSDWNYVTLKGRGVFVGDTLTVLNPVETWWGEGDERIFVDGEGFPSIFGTGTEDYYAYSWGGRSTDFYEHPFHAQPRCNVYNKLNRKSTDERNTQGFSTETRTRALDTMPFDESLQLDMEVWSGTDCNMGYAAGTYWYGDAQTVSNQEPDPDGALAVPPLPEEMR
ncbi:glycoside hydrolase family 172 protein [Pirellulimonas nuda]|nr:glycoside hydrolase family 172 protein [Pirellulimonas nuda]